jgi:scyllo-inositol 2-dehydrogenase (NADP+)
MNNQVMKSPVQTAIASFGMSGLVFHGPSLKINPGFRVKSVWERSKSLSKNLFPDAIIVREFNDLLDDPEIELIIVNTPDALHYEMVKMALQAGKHVVVEKPFVFRSVEADELITLAKARNKILTVYQNRRWDGDFLTINEIVKSGILGRLVEFESHFDRYRPFITPDTWKEEGDEYAGVLYNLGSHTIDQALILFGMPEAVTAHLRILRTGGKVFDYYDIRLHYPSLTALIRCSYLVKEEGPRYILHGTDGSFLKWGIDPQEEMLKKGILPEGDQWGCEPEVFWGTLNVRKGNAEMREKKPTLGGNYPAFYENLYKAIRHGKPLAVKPEEARNVIRILELCLQSNLEQRTVPV